jgi:hypothetical protein
MQFSIIGSIQAMEIINSKVEQGTSFDRGHSLPWETTLDHWSWYIAQKLISSSFVYINTPLGFDLIPWNYEQRYLQFSSNTAHFSAYWRHLSYLTGNMYSIKKREMSIPRTLTTMMCMTDPLTLGLFLDICCSVTCAFVWLEVRFNLGRASSYI